MQMPKGDRPWPLLALGAFFLLVGAGAAWGNLRDKELSYALAAAGLILTGAWLAMEVRASVLHHERPAPPRPTEEEGL